MSLTLVGLSHNTGAPVEVRERLAFTTPGTLQQALEFLKDYTEKVLGGNGEGVLLSTCNRTELYLSLPHGVEEEEIVRVLLSARGLHDPHETEQIRCFISTHQGHQAIEHLFRVASGLDSMIIGENDIVRQVKTAHGEASKAGLCGKTLNPLFHEALRVGKRVRTETDLGRGAFSIGHAAAEVARNIFGAGCGQTVLLLGAGKMSETTARHLTAGGATTVLVANRTYDRAVRLAEALNGHAIHYDAFEKHLAEVDIVVSSTAAPHVVVTQEMVARSLQQRRRRNPLFLLDIAVPRDIEPGVGDLPDVYLYDIDDLQKLVEEDMTERRQRATHAETVVREEAQAFAMKLRTQTVAGPLVSSLRAKVRANIAPEMARLRQRLPHLTDEEWRAVEATFTAVENRLLHDPTLRIKEYAATDGQESAAKMALVRELFALDSPELRDGDKESRSS
ncbi:MAG: glutamyl-tRNA reductase [Armatimonadaceae bacterium]